MIEERLSVSSSTHSAGGMRTPAEIVVRSASSTLIGKGIKRDASMKTVYPVMGMGEVGTKQAT
jgi:hypothetical protein